MGRWAELFQVGTLAAFLVLFVGRTLQLRFAHGVKVISLVRGKPPLEAALGALFVIAFPLWAVDVVAHGWPATQRLAAGVDPVLFEPGWAGAIAPSRSSWTPTTASCSIKPGSGVWSSSCTGATVTASRSPSCGG